MIDDFRDKAYFKGLAKVSCFLLVIQILPFCDNHLWGWKTKMPPPIKLEKQRYFHE